VDVSQRGEIAAMVKAVLEAYGQIDILFNNAGFGRLDFLENLDPVRDIETQLNVNLIGLIQVTRAVLPHMYQQRSGHVINMSSVAGWIAPPLYSIYSASKFGVRGFTDALRRETASCGVHVSGIYPGPAITEFSQHTGKNVIKSSLNLPKFLSMTSLSVARRVVRLARHPRRVVILPWYYNIVTAFCSLFPGLVDWMLVAGFVRKVHLPGQKLPDETTSS
jgi:short-subunit dehydrogenase